MARIFDNIDNDLLTTLRATMQVSNRSDFCVGYLNLRGWQAIDDLIALWDPAAGQVCRVLVGMQRPPHEEIRELYRQTDEAGLIDNATASRLKTQFAAHLREQIAAKAPVYPVCIEQELDSWLLASHRAISAHLSTAAHPYSVKRARAPDEVMQPKAAMIKHFKLARRWTYDDKVDAIRVLKAADVDLGGMRRSPSFARFESKLLG